MSYKAIYRKWRPIIFDDVIGQEHITNTLKNEIMSNRISHAFMFCGTRGTGKTTTAKILSRAVNCENPINGNPCNECSFCKGILNDSEMDVIEIDAASNNGVDDIRQLREEALYAPGNAKYKVYIIDEVHMLSNGASNALLKTLEEPPAHVIFILATTDPQKVLNTIQSRCQRFDFKRITVHNISGRIGEIVRKDNLNITPDAIKLIAQIGDGSMRDALSVLDLCAGIEGEITVSDIENLTGSVSKKTVLDICRCIIDKDLSNALIKINEAVNNGREVTNIITEMTETFRELMITSILNNPNDIIDRTEEEIIEYKDIIKNATKSDLIFNIKTLCNTLYECKNTTQPLYLLEAGVINMCEGQTFSSISPQKPNVQGQISKSVEIKPPEYINKAIETDDENKKVDVKPTKKTTYDAFVAELTKSYPPLGSLLLKTKCRRVGNVADIIFNNEAIRDLVSSNKEYVEILKQQLNVEILNCFTDFEFTNIKKTTKTNQTDPLIDLINKGEQIDNVTIL